MITFLRKIRQSLIKSGSTRRYFMYASGEIMLVVVGILIALQINNWNEGRKNRAREVRLLNQLKSNLLVNEQRLSEDIAAEKLYFNSSKIIVHHLDNYLPYHDSLKVHFAMSQLSADIVLATSAYEAIKSIGFDVISSDSLRTAIIDLFDANYTFMVRNTLGLEDQFWPSVVLPLWIKHLRHVSMDNLEEGQRPMDYNALLADKDFASMLEKRGIFRMLAADLKTESLLKTRALMELINVELDGK